LFETLVIVNTNDDWSGFFREAIIESADLVIVRQNHGYDFGAWKSGLHEILQNDIPCPKDVILINDSVYWLPNSIESLRKFLSSSDSSLWSSLTKSEEISLHAQSYLQRFNSEALISEPFKEWWLNYRPTSNRSETIHRGEIALSTYLLKHGFLLNPLFNEESLERFLALRPEFPFEMLPLCIPQQNSNIHNHLENQILNAQIYSCFSSHNPIHHFSAFLSYYDHFPIKVDIPRQFELVKLREILDHSQIDDEIEKKALERLFGVKFLPF
jgi:hypothetical protein